MSPRAEPEVVRLLRTAAPLWRYEGGRSHYLAALRDVARGASGEAAGEVGRLVARVLRADLERVVRDLEAGLARETEPASRAQLVRELGDLRAVVEQAARLEAAP